MRQCEAQAAQWGEKWDNSQVSRALRAEWLTLATHCRASHGIGTSESQSAAVGAERKPIDEATVPCERLLGYRTAQQAGRIEPFGSYEKQRIATERLQF